ncbi:hypothetical protein BRCON_2238 [Candidatus Sumerlaea chitinivorans]|uniref:Uncharacterized protein n=1 Tax=Sumerlaea chitinivorans TaxID=2250252 RepID=A0A2Z4Y9E1_SUMC1|nr:hypothetical protein BRCON_2238 [Candidatus Sumerlaea chitinivorans]
MAHVSQDRVDATSDVARLAPLPTHPTPGLNATARHEYFHA